MTSCFLLVCIVTLISQPQKQRRIAGVRSKFAYIFGLVDFIATFSHDFVGVDHQTPDRHLPILQSVFGLRRHTCTAGQRRAAVSYTDIQYYKSANDLLFNSFVLLLCLFACGFPTILFEMFLMCPLDRLDLFFYASELTFST